jgi:hypothetical protein
MIPVSTPVVANGGRYTASAGYQRFERKIFVGGSCNGFIEVINVSLMMFTMMDLHGKGIDVWF